MTPWHPPKASFRKVRANKEHRCLVCNKIIPVGIYYFAKTEHSEFLANKLEAKCHLSMWEIKRRTKFFYCDMITWRFCSLECMQKVGHKRRNELPLDIQERLENMECTIVKTVGETLTMMAKLQGSAEPSNNTYSSWFSSNNTC